MVLILAYNFNYRCAMVRVCITGTPGTGKSEIAKRLAKELGWEMVELNELAKKKGCIAGYDDKRECKEVDVDRLAKEVDKMEGNLVLESHFAHYMPCDAVFVLRVDPSELKERLKKKGWKEEKIKENIEAEITEVCKSEALEEGKKVYEIDTTNKSPEEVVEEILKVINPYLG